MVQLYRAVLRQLSCLRDIPPLLFRLVLAQGFFVPAIVKLKNVDALIAWLGKLGVPMPTLNAYLSLITETTGVILLLLGLATRLISIPLMVVMVIAISTVHWANGFPCGSNGFQIPFYFLLMLLYLVINGPGRFSVDALIAEKYDRRT